SLVKLAESPAGFAVSPESSSSSPCAPGSGSRASSERFRDSRLRFAGHPSPAAQVFVVMVLDYRREQPQGRPPEEGERHLLHHPDLEWEALPCGSIMRASGAISCAWSFLPANEPAEPWSCRGPFSCRFCAYVLLP